jgi:hypothetical protein
MPYQATLTRRYEPEQTLNDLLLRTGRQHPTDASIIMARRRTARSTDPAIDSAGVVETGVVSEFEASDQEDPR